MWDLVKDRGIQYFQLQWRNFSAFYTIKSNEKKVLKILNPHFLKQIHSDNIIDIDCCADAFGDGLITAKKDCLIGVKVADCLPVYIFADEKICIIHCGWRGIIKGIAKKAAILFNDYRYALGASIGLCCYEVKEDIAELFKKNYKRVIIKRGAKYYCDLKAAVIEDLGEEKLIDSLDFCTHCHDEYFYSYRRGDKKYRNYAFMKVF
jgi:YfiH family protein